MSVQTLPGYWKRDMSRLSDAVMIEEQSKRYVNADNGMIHVQLIKGRVQKGSEISSLLHYISHKLRYHFGAWHLSPREDVRLLDDSTFHITPQTAEQNDDQQYVEIAEVDGNSAIADMLDRKNATPRRA
jgi:hypothetical protein